jgi:hypothetical protein
MALLNDVKGILDRLAPRGWSALFQIHGLDITVSLSLLETELSKPLSVIRSQPGFEEFAFNGTRAVDPGSPGRSLLYHALASADVAPDKPTLTAEDFPTLEEIDVVENYVYSVAKRTLADFSNPVLGVFAYQYREKSLSPHREHADLAFSRCGVARVGTEAERFDAAARSFDPRSQSGDRGFAVLPARYGLFLAEYRTPGSTDHVLRSVPSDASQTFLFPVHKLFAGKECLFEADRSTPVTIPALKFAEYHLDEKLKRLHTAGPDNPGRVPPLPQFNLNEAPFFRDSKNSSLVSLRTVGSSVLVVPVPGLLAKTANQKVSGVNELVRYKVPKRSASGNNRFWTSLQLSSTNRGRAAPEYANMRQEAVPKPAGGFRIVDLNLIPEAGTPANQKFDKKLQDGGYEAAHFVDDTCDGFLSVTVPAVLGSLSFFPGYSLVAAVDYFPQVEQVEITEWIEEKTNQPIGLGDPTFQFPQSGPAPLSDGRFMATQLGALVPTRRIPNQSLTLTAGTTAFPPTEAASSTVTAVVGRAASASSGTRINPSGLVATWLPDAASDIFAPGWDVSQHIVGGRGTYVTYGLGSPFPEDAKLCAVLNSYWPAAAPDSSRTFGFFAGSSSLLPTSIPLTDGELGYNAKHPRVLAGEVTATLGWDGETGPYLTASGATVNAANVNRSDQTRQAFDGKLGFSGLDKIQTQDFIARMEALRFAQSQIPTPTPTQSGPWLVTVEAVPLWQSWTSSVAGKLNATLSGPGHLFVFAYVNATPIPVGDPPLRLEYPVLQLVAIQLDNGQAFLKVGSGPVKRVVRI